MTRLLTVPEVCDMLGVNEATLRIWRNSGKLPVWIRVGRQVRYRDTDIEAFLDANENRHIDDPEPAA